MFLFFSLSFSRSIERQERVITPHHNVSTVEDTCGRCIASNVTEKKNIPALTNWPYVAPFAALLIIVCRTKRIEQIMKMSENGRWMSTLSRLFFFSFSFSQILSGSMPAVRCWTMENCSLYRYQNVIILTLANEWIKLKFNRKFFALKLNSWQSWYLYAVNDELMLHSACRIWPLDTWQAIDRVSFSTASNCNCTNSNSSTITAFFLWSTM